MDSGFFFFKIKVYILLWCTLRKEVIKRRILWTPRNVGVHNIQGKLLRGAEELCPAYLIGSQWALSTKHSIIGIPKEQLQLQIGEEIFDLEKLSYYENKLSKDESTIELDLAIFKVKIKPRSQGNTLLCPEYPMEYSSVSAISGEGPYTNYNVVQYDDCFLKYGRSNGIFCLDLRNSSLPQPGTGVFYNGMLAGLVGNQQTINEQMFAVTAIAPTTFWIVDMMSEAIPR